MIRDAALCRSEHEYTPDLIAGWCRFRFFEVQDLTQKESGPGTIFPISCGHPSGFEHHAAVTLVSLAAGSALSTKSGQYPGGPTSKFRMFSCHKPILI
jgi:hypothetical protein